ncbi:MAG: TIGR02281 family clan AA aspartic protease, partial [Alphaproteobacteria bacterium]
LRAGTNGHYRVDAVVDGARLTFLVDTGASHVVLSLADARKLGFNPDTMAYTQVYSTANGLARGAPVVLGSITIGGIRVTDVDASVNQAPMAGSLLGMSFLGRLSAYEVRNGSLTLRQ